MAKLRFNHRSAGIGLLALSIISIALLATACARPSAKIDQTAYAEEIAQYRIARLAELKSDNGYLSLVGLFWLKEGEHKFCSGPANEIGLPLKKLIHVTPAL